jgi:hypothetical protein
MTNNRFIVLSVGIALAVAAGCVRSNSSSCGPLVCPNNTTCMSANTTPVCVDTDLVQACAGASNGAPCFVPGLGSNVCEGGVCQASRCGDGRVTGKEQCDGTNLGDKTCQSIGFYSETGLACNSDCTFNTSGCTGYCGDGIKNGPELCDGADLGSATCFDAGYYGAKQLGCNKDCTFDATNCTGGHCGDGTVNGLEECDGSALGTVNGSAASCEALGYLGSLSTLACSNACTYSSASCLCTTGRCQAGTEKCVCSKTGCGCVAK